MSGSLRAVRRLYDSVGPNPWVVRLAFRAKGVRLVDVDTFPADAAAQEGEGAGAGAAAAAAAVERYTLKVKDRTPENRHPSMLAKNAAGTTPCIELEDGSVVAESIAICEYLDALYPASGPRLTGGPGAAGRVQTTMWTQRVQLGITAPFQRQYQYGEGFPYFRHHVPWAEASQAGLAGLRQQTTDTLAWLEATMQARSQAGDGEDNGFISGRAGSETYTLPDLQLYCTAKFMGNPKVNRAKLTESFDPASTHFGPWLQDWFGRMDEIVQSLEQ